MSTGEAKPEAQAAPAAEARSVLEQAIEITSQTTERSRATELVEAFAGEAVKGTLVYKKDLIRSIQACVQAFDAKISQQLAAIMHTPGSNAFRSISWSGFDSTARYLPR